LASKKLSAKESDTSRAAAQANVPDGEGVDSSARLGFTLFLAATLHMALMLGIGFSLPKSPSIPDSLDVTLAVFDDVKKNQDADFIAQSNQEGSGTLEKKEKVTSTTENALFQDNETREFSLPPAVKEPAKSQNEQPSLAVKGEQMLTQTQKQPEEKQPLQTSELPNFDNEQLSAQIASLTAELSDAQQNYAKRPRIHRITSASARSDIAAWYMSDWQKKVVRIGNLNYPEEARRLRIYGQLRLLVRINRDGSLLEMHILESSGHQVLDDAAKRIVRLAAPFSPFSGELAQQQDQLEIIRTWSFERNNRLVNY